MAVTTESSTQYKKDNAPTTNGINQHYDQGVPKYWFFSFTQGAAAGDANSTMDLRQLPPGKFRIIGQASYVRTSAFGASRTLDIGHTGYTKADGTTVAADEDAIHSAADVSSAGGFVPADENYAAGSGGTILIDSATAVTIEAKVEGGTIPAGATIDGFLVTIGA
jgi:hypothetical protein